MNLLLEAFQIRGKISISASSWAERSEFKSQQAANLKSSAR